MMASRIVVTIMSPKNVVICEETLPPPARGEVLVETLHTAVSSGTEMLVYRGDMPDEMATDATITILQKPFSYPISYGYCNVGRVAALGPDTSLFCVGATVFSFREHCSKYVAAEDSLHLVPPDTNPQDACLLPAVETALSIAMDAALLPGESAVIVGQGFIGLMVTACLKILHPLSAISTVDIDLERRRLSLTAGNADASFGPDVTYQDVGEVDQGDDTGGADVSIDTSGRGDGLDTAIKLTRDGGKVVLASWFGNKTVQLTSLGGRFHRSHMSIIASQVSMIPHEIRARWSKKRRFALAWRLLRIIKPSERFPMTVMSSREAPSVYKDISCGKYLQVIFEYDDK